MRRAQELERLQQLKGLCAPCGKHRRGRPWLFEASNGRTGEEGGSCEEGALDRSPNTPEQAFFFLS